MFKSIQTMPLMQLFEKLVAAIILAFCTGLILGTGLTLAVFVYPLPDFYKNTVIPIVLVGLLVIFWISLRTVIKSLLIEIKKRVARL